LVTKRQFKRVGIVSGIQVTPLGKKGRYKGYVANVSRGGMAIYITAPLKVNGTVELKLTFVDDEGLNWSEAVVGKVKWIHKKFVAAAGIEFEDLTERKHPTLMAVLTQKGKK
jgi:c-di-GMP-binding flagellar brake protein YcgR